MLSSFVTVDISELFLFSIFGELFSSLIVCSVVSIFCSVVCSVFVTFCVSVIFLFSGVMFIFSTLFSIFGELFSSLIISLTVSIFSSRAVLFSICSISLDEKKKVYNPYIKIATTKIITVSSSKDLFWFEDDQLYQ